MELTWTLTRRPRNKAELQKKKAGEKWKGIWYVRWKLPDGSWSGYKSTGKAAKSDAIKWCQEHAAEFSQPSPSGITLKEYTAGFFDWPDGRYAIDRQAGGHRASYRSAQSHRIDCKNHVLRILGEDTPVSDISRRDTRRLRDTLFQESKAPSTINHVINTLSIILAAAEEDEIIDGIPRIYRAGGGARETRGLLSVQEAQSLFTDAKWRTVQERYASEVAARTGLRKSEILGLTHDRYHSGYIDVSQVWDDQSWTLKGATKSGASRVVPISRRIRKLLLKLMRSSPYRDRPQSERYIFYHPTNSAAPYDARDITEGLYDALYQIGMNPATRKVLGITFHSWRHFANSQMIDAGIPETTVRALIGHQSREMSFNYYHAQDLAAIVAVQDSW